MPERSIPACTGEPHASGAYKLTSRVYPRVYGGTRHNPLSRPLYHGLSPRVRGNPGASCASTPRDRSIPACTGEPGVVITVGGKVQAAVYPRVYGGTGEECAPKRLIARGSIPACTGEPSQDLA